jgi:crotonobetainyl-CoA:carnitine CoA-transferase CaiB-like acyl-CoA transferase
VVLRLTGFGQTGPYAQRAGFARIFEAMSGFTNLTGETGGAPLHMNYPMGDMVAGLFGAFAIASAIAERRRPGNEAMPGQEIDLAATEALFRLLEPLAVEYEQLGQVRQRAGNRATYTAPSNMYATADGQWVSLVASSGPIFRRLCLAIGRPGMADDRASPPTRRGCAIWTRSMKSSPGGSAAMPMRMWQAPSRRTKFRSARFSRSPISSTIRTFKNGRPSSGCPIRTWGRSRHPAWCRGSPDIPTAGQERAGVGEHNAEVYGALGLTAADLTGLREGGVI